YDPRSVLLPALDAGRIRLPLRKPSDMPGDEDRPGWLRSDRVLGAAVGEDAMGSTVVRRQSAGRRHSTVLVLVLCLSFATGAALVGAGMALTDPNVAWSASVEQQAKVSLVDDFYDAVNVAIRTGDADDLDPIVAPDVDWCPSCPGRAPTRDDLKDYLAD